MRTSDKKAAHERMGAILHLPGQVTPTLAEGQVDTVRDIETITQEIQEAQRTAGQSIITIGKDLIEAKAMLPHGEWLPWLAEKVGYSERTAQGFMQLARKYSNPQLVADLGMRKALALLALPDPEREEFLSAPHTVDGEEKNVIDMTSRELERAIKERDEAKKAEEQAKADTRAAQDARESMEKSLKAANDLLDRARIDKGLAEETISALEQQLAELKAAPIEVAVMEMDQKKLDAARAEGEAAKAEEIAKLQKKLEKAQENQKKSDEQRKQAEASVEKLKAKLEAEAKAKEEAAAQAEKKVLLADPDVAAFKVYLREAQDIVNKMNGLRLKAKIKEDKSISASMDHAMAAYIEFVQKEAAK